MSFELLPHTADLRASITSANLDGLYASGAELVRTILVADSAVEARDRRVLPPASPDEAESYFRYLRELVYLFEAEGFVPAVAVGAGVAVDGELYDPARHTGGYQIKAVTRHAYRFEHRPDGYRVQVVFDI
jgi:SHS2 domain-containing protein